MFLYVIAMDESAAGLKPDEKNITPTSNCGEDQQEDHNEEDEVLQVDCACSYNEVPFNVKILGVNVE